MNGVDYITKNNKEEQRITKYADGEAAFTGKDSVLKVNDDLFSSPVKEEALVSSELSSSTPLQESDVLRCLVQLWDNGENSKQRYKLKIRLNLIDGSDVDFIAPLTKDPRNFIKYTADKELARQWRDKSNQMIKMTFGVRPWLGKFHMVQTQYSSTYHQQTIEPNCFATVWWDEDAKDWSATFMLYDFALEEVDMQSRNVTEKQKSQGCRSSRLWINPQHTQKTRPQTWAEKRMANK